MNQAITQDSLAIHLVLQSEAAVRLHVDDADHFFWASIQLLVGVNTYFSPSAAKFRALKMFQEELFSFHGLGQEVTARAL